MELKRFIRRKNPMGQKNNIPVAQRQLSYESVVGQGVEANQDHVQVQALFDGF